MCRHGRVAVAAVDVWNPKDMFPREESGCAVGLGI
jgi:hypothetical protein